MCAHASDGALRILPKEEEAVIKVLIVEDDNLNREMIARRLGWEGYATLTAANGADGIAVAQAELPDAILMDMGLPVLNGWQATEQLKAAQETCSIPIIALTAFATSEDRERALAAGCDAFETKPINFDRLLEKIMLLTNARKTI